MYKKIVTVCLIAGMVLTGCAGKSGSTTNSSEATSKGGNVREIHYFSSRSASDDTMVTLQEITDKYNEQGGNIKLVIDSNADRSSYDQKAVRCRICLIWMQLLMRVSLGSRICLQIWMLFLRR